MSNENYSWTQEEIDRYISFRRRELSPMYFTAGIPKEKPWEREDLLKKKLRESLQEENEGLAIGDALFEYINEEIGGRAETLLELENLVLERF